MGFKESSDEFVETLYGSSAKKTKVIGYCHFHHRYLTIPQLKEKQCLARQCARLYKLERPYWEQREIIKQKKKFKKDAEKDKENALHPCLTP